MPTSWRAPRRAGRSSSRASGFAYDVDRRRRDGGPRRLRDLLRPAVPEPDAVLALAERAGDLLDPAQPDQLAPSASASWPASASASIRCRPRRRRTTRCCRPASFGRINDPDAEEPYVQKVSLGFQHSARQRLDALQRLRAHARHATSRASRSSTRASSASATRRTRARRRLIRAARAA